MKQLEKTIDSMGVLEGQFFRNLAIFPVQGKESSFEYLVFDEAVNRGLEIRETGSVPTLDMNNKSGKEVLILQGEYVQGGKQNRMVSTNIFMANGFNGQVPVNCVQHHRWTPNVYSGAPMDSTKKRATSEIRYAASQGQGEVWDTVCMLSANLSVHSPTQDLHEVYQKKSNDSREFVQKFSYVPNTLGVVSCINNRGNLVWSADLFDRSSTMQKHYNKLVESLAMGAMIGGEDIKDFSSERVREFLTQIKDSSAKERKAVSLGEDYELTGSNGKGFALTYKETPLYVSFVQRPNLSHRIEPNPFQIMEEQSQGYIKTGFRRIR